ncbi:MAG: hypothetical protein C5B48_03580 [Candidatus Rokuibacteriota bacterium]|nr:MAG: hypothetical protein C5B48_03580 [Candidatus Rokubacteria bacterium]
MGGLRAAVGLTVVAAAVIAMAVAVLSLGKAVRLFDWHAQQNGARGYFDRLYGEPFNIVGSPKVLADALAWMPPDATYAVVTGPRSRVERGLARSIARPLTPAYLEFLLLPRRQTSLGSARWLFCYGCDTGSLDRRFKVLSGSGKGIFFGRLGP